MTYNLSFLRGVDGLSISSASLAMPRKENTLKARDAIQIRFMTRVIARMKKGFTINQISDREFRAGEHHYLLGDDNIFYVTLNGDADDEMGIEIDRAIYRMVDNVDGQIDLLIDLNRAGKTSSRSRQLFKTFTETSKCRKVALFGMHPVAMVISSFVMGISRNRKMKFFKKREEAMEWLKQE